MKKYTLINLKFAAATALGRMNETQRSHTLASIRNLAFFLSQIAPDTPMTDHTLVYWLRDLTKLFRGRRPTGYLCADLCTADLAFGCTAVMEIIAFDDGSVELFVNDSLYQDSAFFSDADQLEDASGEWLDMMQLDSVTIGLFKEAVTDFLDTYRGDLEEAAAVAENAQ